MQSCREKGLTKGEKKQEKEKMQYSAEIVGQVLNKESSFTVAGVEKPPKKKDRAL